MDDRARLIGTWKLESYRLTGEEELYPLGHAPQGIIFYDAAGNMACNLANPDPAGADGVTATGLDAFRARVAWGCFSGYFGRWEIDENARLVHHHVEAALMPQWAGTTVTRRYRFDGGNALELSARPRPEMEAVLRWVRAG